MTSTGLPDLRIELAPAADALAEAGRRVAELLRSVPDPAAPTRGLDWSLGELAAHLGARTGLFVDYLSGTTRPRGEIEDIAANNERQLRSLEGVPFTEHVARFEANVAAFAETTKGRLGTDPYPWYSGLTLDVAIGTGIALAEVLVHGYDVARSIGRRWPIEAEDARTIVRASFALAPRYVDPRTTARTRTTYRVLVRGGPRLRFRIDRGTGAVLPVEGPADCSIRAEPAALVLVSYGRMSRWRAAAAGRLIGGGRRPWRALALSRSFLPP